MPRALSAKPRQILGAVSNEVLTGLALGHLAAGQFDRAPDRSRQCGGFPNGPWRWRRRATSSDAFQALSSEW